MRRHVAVSGEAEQRDLGPRGPFPVEVALTRRSPVTGSTEQAPVIVGHFVQKQHDFLRIR